MNSRSRVGSLVLASCVLAACGRSPAKETSPPAASVDKKTRESDLARVTLAPEAESRLGIELAVVEEKKLPRHRVVGGEIVVPSGGALQLTAPVAATVAAGKIAAAGTSVKRGEPIVSLVPLAPVDRDLRSQAERQRGAAEARFTAAEQRLKRAEQLLADGAGSAKLVEEASAERGIAKAEIDAANQRVSSMSAHPLASDVAVTIRAPHDGVIRQVGVSPGQIVAAGTLLVEVVGTSAIWVRVPLFVAEARRVRPDAHATVTALGGGESRDAVPAHGPLLADPASATMDLTYELEGAHGFRPGERVEVDLTYAGDGNELVVPASAIMRDIEGGAWVYEALGDHVFSRRRVDVARVEGPVAVLARGPRPQVSIVRAGAAELWGVELGAGH